MFSQLLKKSPLEQMAKLRLRLQKLSIIENLKIYIHFLQIYKKMFNNFRKVNKNNINPK